MHPAANNWLLIAETIQARDFIATKHREYILTTKLKKPKSSKNSKREDEDEDEDEQDEIEAADYDDDDDEQGNTQMEDDDSVYAASFERQLSLDAIDIGPDFVALAGNFPDSAFIDLLHGEEDIDYVEVNQVYKATLIPPYHDQVHPEDELKLVEQKQLEKRDIKVEACPNWGLSRINQRLLGDFESYSYDETAG